MTTRAVHVARILSPRERTSLRARRILLLALVAVLICTLVFLQQIGLQRTSYTTGYVLYAAIVFLQAFQFRKWMPSLPLGKASTWMQLHIYIGYLAISIFGLHVGLRLPHGWLESALYAVFVAVVGSGLYGLYMTRTIPAKLRAIPEEVIYEQIPALRQAIANEAETLVCGATQPSAVLSRIYDEHLRSYFERSPSWSYLVLPSGNRRRWLLAELHGLHRYLGPEPLHACEQLERLVARRDDLDFHAALQGRLKAWLFVHIGLTYSLLLLATTHGLLVHAFGGRA